MLTAERRNDRRTTLVAVGDLMLGDSPLAAGYGFHSRYPGDRAQTALEGLRPALAGADLVFGNLETQLTREGYGRTELARNMMRGDPEYASVLRNLGFNVLAVANNHAMQHGAAAFDETVATLRGAGIDVAGLRGSPPWNALPVRRRAADVTIGILAYSFRPRQYGTGSPSYATGTEDAILGDVRRLRPEVDHVVVSLHWGEEFVAHPSTSEVRFAKQVIDAGAVLLLGHHPHVVRPVVLEANGCIAYSLGNAASDMIWQSQLRLGIALRCRLGDVTPEIDAIPIMTNRDYCVSTSTLSIPLSGSADVCGLDENEYQKSIRLSMRNYRRAALFHMIRNVWRSPVTLTAGLLTEKARNLVARLAGRTP